MLTPKQKEKAKRNKLKNSARAIGIKVIKHKFGPLRKKCDNLFSLYIRLVRDKDKGCITCGNFDRKMDCGHYQVRQHMNTRYSEMNCAKQCCYCNDEFGGEQVKFGRRIDEIYGEGTSEALEILAHQVGSVKVPEMLEIYNRYYRILVDKKIPIPKSYIVKKYLTN